jgi:hypothetical protein
VKRATIAFATVLAAAFGCTVEVDALPSASRSPLVYGRDDRLDYYALPDHALRERMARSTLAFVDRERVTVSADGAVELAAAPYDELYRLCPGARFEQQPSAAQCSGVLIAPDLVLTAAHCVRRVACSDWRLVFGYYYDAPDQLHPLHADDVFACAEVASEDYSRAGSATETDYAIVVLDRPVDDAREPAVPHLADEPMHVGEPLTVIGHGAGLPAKADSGGRVADARADALDHFLATTDTFDGSSGSGVYDAEGVLRGVLSRGGDDYETGALGNCRRLRQLSDELPRAEEKVTYIARALDGLCESPFRDAALCGGSAAPGCSATGRGARVPGFWPWVWLAGALLARAGSLTARGRRSARG